MSDTHDWRDFSDPDLSPGGSMDRTILRCLKCGWRKLIPPASSVLATQIRYRFGGGQDSPEQTVEPACTPVPEGRFVKTQWEKS